MQTLNSLNYAMLGKSCNCRNAKDGKRQEFWLKESESKIMEAKDKKSELRGNPDTDSIPAGYSMTSLLQMKKLEIW